MDIQPIKKELVDFLAAYVLLHKPKSKAQEVETKENNRKWAKQILKNKEAQSVILDCISKLHPIILKEIHQVNHVIDWRRSPDTPTHASKNTDRVNLQLSLSSMMSNSSPSSSRQRQNIQQTSKESEKLNYFQQLRDNLSKIENIIKDVKEQRREIKELDSIERASFLTTDISLNEQIVSKLQELCNHEVPFIQDIRDISHETWKEHMDFEKMLKEEMRSYQTKYNQIEMNYFYRLEAVKEKCIVKIETLESRIEDLISDFMLKLNRLEMTLNDAQTKEYEIYVKNEEELRKAFEQEKINDLPAAMKKIERLYMAKKVMQTKIENSIKDINLLKNKLIAMREQNEYIQTQIRQAETQNKLLKSCLYYFLELSKLPDAQVEKVKKWAGKEKFSKIVEKFASGDLHSAKTLENITLRVQTVREKVSELALNTVDKDTGIKLFKVLNDLKVEDIVQNSELQVILSLPEELKLRFSSISTVETPKSIESAPKKNTTRKVKSKVQAVHPSVKLVVDPPITYPSENVSRRSIHRPKDLTLDSILFKHKSSVDEPKQKYLKVESKLATPAATKLSKTPSGLSELLAPKANLTNLEDDIDKEIENRLKALEEAHDTSPEEVSNIELPTVTPPKDLIKELTPITASIPDISNLAPDIQIKPTKTNTPRQPKSKTVPPIFISKKPGNTTASSKLEPEIKSEQPKSSTTQQSIIYVSQPETETDRLNSESDLYNTQTYKDLDEMDFLGRSERIQIEVRTKYQESLDSRLDTLTDKRTSSRQTLNYKLSGSQISDSYSDIYQMKTFDKTFDSSGVILQHNLENLKVTMSNIIRESSRPSSKLETPKQRAVSINNSISKVMNSEISVGDESYKISYAVNWFIDNYFKESTETSIQTDKSYDFNDEPRVHNYMNAIRGILLKNMKEKSIKATRSKESVNNEQSLSGAKIDQYFNSRYKHFEGDYKFQTQSEPTDSMSSWLQNAALRTAVAYEEYKAEFIIEARRLGIKKIEIKDAAKIWDIVIRRRLRDSEGDDISVYLRGFQGTDRFDSEVNEIVQLLQYYKKNELIQKIQKLPSKIHTHQEVQQKIREKRKPLVISRWREVIVRVSANYARKMGRCIGLNSNLLDVWYEMAKNVGYVADRISRINERCSPIIPHHLEKKSSEMNKGWNVSNSPNILRKNQNMKEYYTRKMLNLSISVTPNPREIRSRSRNGAKTAKAHKLRVSTNSEERRGYKKVTDFMITARLPEIQKEKS